MCWKFWYRVYFSAWRWLQLLEQNEDLFTLSVQTPTSYFFLTFLLACQRFWVSAAWILEYFTHNIYHSILPGILETKIVILKILRLSVSLVQTRVAKNVQIMHLVNFVIIWGIKVNLDLVSTHLESFWVQLIWSIATI